MSEIADSLWRATQAAPPRADPVLDADATADVLVVGGGFCGLSAALHLAEAGRDVVLLEAEEIGFGASGRNGGQVNPGLKFGEPELVEKFGEDGRRFFRMGQEGPDFLAALVARKRLRCGFVRSGLIRLAHNPRAVATLRGAAATLRAQGVPVEDLDAPGVERMVGTRRYPGGLLDLRGASVQPLDLVRELARVAQEAGVRIFCASRAATLRQEGRDWVCGVGRHRVRACTVVVATNAYTDGLIPRLAETVLPVNSFQIATAPLPAALEARLLPGSQTVYDSRRLVLYFRKSADRRMVIGGRATFSGARGVSDRRPDYSVLQGVLHGIFPDLGGVPVEKRWTGLVGITRDFLPHYHRPAEGLHVVLGFNGRGVALANRAGAWLANLVTGAEDACAIPRTAIEPIPLHRFRAPALDIAMRWNRLLDILGR